MMITKESTSCPVKIDYSHYYYLLPIFLISRCVSAVITHPVPLTWRQLSNVLIVLFSHLFLIFRNVTRLNCYNCPLLTSLPSLPNTKYLYCSNCPLLTSLPSLPLVIALNCWNCKWLDHPNNKDYTKNLKSLKILQWYKKNRKARRFVKLTTSRSFNESFFSREGLGGIWHTKNMMGHF